MACLNPQSLAKDVLSVASGGYFLYDSTKVLHKEFIREDIHYLVFQ
jgi:2-oxoglutarate ferredoxin oxidoreductase subunit alpha